MLSRTPRPDTKHKRKSSLLDLLGLGQSREPAPEISAPIPNSLQQYTSSQALQGELIDLTLGAKRDSSHFAECETPPKRRSYYDPNTDQLSPIQNVDAANQANETISLRNQDSSRDYTHLGHSAQPSLSESLHDSESHCMSESQPQTPQTDYADDFDDDGAVFQAECVEFSQPRFQTMNPASMHSVSTLGDGCVRVGCSSPAFSDDPFKKRESLLSISTLDRTPSKRKDKNDLIDRYLNSLYDSEHPPVEDDMDVDVPEFSFPRRNSSLPQSASSRYSAHIQVDDSFAMAKSVQVDDASFAMVNPYTNGSSSTTSVNRRVPSSGQVTRKPVPQPAPQPAESLMGEFETELARLDSIGTFTELPPPVSYPSSIVSDKLTPHPALVSARNTAPGSRNGSQRDISRGMAGMSIASNSTQSVNYAARHPQAASTPSVVTTDTKSKRHSLSGKFGKLKDFGRRITHSKPAEQPAPAPTPRPASQRSDNTRRRSMLGFNFGSSNEKPQPAHRRTSTFGNINVAPVINMRFESEKPDIGRGF
ncbi:hypothetical protein CJU89_2381 [Yarrowia sp. B02]|nr:hypothetical protein CJU89_2381 [Yarrowia sp. B02]